MAIFWLHSCLSVSAPFGRHHTISHRLDPIYPILPFPFLFLSFPFLVLVISISFNSSVYDRREALCVLHLCLLVRLSSPSIISHITSMHFISFSLSSPLYEPIKTPESLSDYLQLFLLIVWNQGPSSKALLARTQQCQPMTETLT